MKSDTGAVGGFFEDLPVLAFVLAGVLSVAGTACWASELLSDGERSDAVEHSASQLIVGIVLEMQDSDVLPTVEAVRSANLSDPIGALSDRFSCLVSIWHIHPGNERLMVVGSCEGAPALACSARVLMNVICDDGAVGILEVRVFVWEV
jgi:hypothetical protein